MSEIRRHVIVGANLGREGEAVPRLLDWLRKEAGPSLRATAVHVLEARELDGLLEAHDLAGAAELAASQAQEGLVRTGAADVVDQVVVVAGAAAHTLLEREVGRRGASTLLIGRDCGRRDAERLGRVGSALLKSLVVPTIVVPRVLDEERLTTGPVVVAMTADPHSVDAYRFARAVATARERELVVLTVVPGLEPNSVFANDDARREQLRVLLDAGRQNFGQWLADQELDPGRLEVSAGVPGPAILEVCERERAALVVCGSRRLSTVGRVFSHSVSVELAGSAPCPVAVVPGR